ncbi:MAG: hypothetical protein ACLR4Z_07355 [Butyricicoccaceae bacterium]
MIRGEGTVDESVISGDSELAAVSRIRTCWRAACIPARFC